MRYSDLSDNLLIESYQKAVELDLDISFIALLENELLVRYILHYKQSKLEIKS
nr:sporulation histidine kinase inhibitor Sda [Aquibacillus kalidii]